MLLVLDEQLLSDAQEFSIYFKLCIRHVISNAQCVFFLYLNNTKNVTYYKF